MAPKKASSASKGKKKEVENQSKAQPTVISSSALYEEDDYYREPIKRTVKPDNQLVLTEEQLDEDFTRVLTANDPNLANNITKYNYKEKAYKQDPEGPMDHLIFHLNIDGCSMHKEGEDALAQIQVEDEKKMEADRLKKEAAQEAFEAGEENIEADAPKTGKNQFNYSERAAQTFNNLLRSRGVATEPPPVQTFNATITQWDIFDAYMQDLKNIQLEDELLKNAERRKLAGAVGATPGEDTSGQKKGKDDDMVHSQKMSNALKILERMVNQNAEDEIFQDFKYWEDISDAYRPGGEGSLLPLWRFSTERTKRKQVTTLCWNPNYPDLFAVAYGSYDFMRQGSGIVCCFSLKNTSHPEYMFSTESGVMCLDFHPHHQSLLAVGCYDGTVMVFDVRNKINRAIYSSSIRTGKHTDPVWQVHWQEEDLAKELNFFSISSDGQVASWIMSKNELKMEPVMQLKLVSNARDDPEDVNLSGLAGGCCFSFNKYNEHLFIVGTEEGKIHKCSKAYSGQYLETYQGHHMAVYTLKWNPFHPRVFISCSADWTVKIWDHNLPNPVCSFDLGNAVGDVSWAPYSSTVFAAVTSDGKVMDMTHSTASLIHMFSVSCCDKVHVFDLAENKHEPLCEQKVVKRAKLTHVSFNQRDPILIVGDDRGGVNSMKLSPNLRKVRVLRFGVDLSCILTAVCFFVLRSSRTDTRA
jgi:dynein intermediate chain 1